MKTEEAHTIANDWESVLDNWNTEWKPILNPFKKVSLNFTLFLLNSFSLENKKGIFDLYSGIAYTKYRNMWFYMELNEN